jgi:Flp pilus assembly protein TadG
MFSQGAAGIVRRAEGATVVEYAIILPVLLMLIMGILEYNTLMYAMSVLDGSITTAAREGSTDYTAAGFSSRQAYVYSLVQTHSQGLLNPTNLTVSSKSYANFSDIGQPEPCISPPTPPCPGTPGVNFVDVNGNGVWDQDQGTSGVGGAGDIVVYTATYPWPIYTPILRPFLGSGGTYMLSASAVVKNEPFNSTSSR